MNTGPSVQLMRDIIVKKSVPDNTVKEWISALTFVPDPNAEMLDAASDILEKTVYNHHIVLGVSSLMRTYCAKHPSCRYDNQGVFSTVMFLEKLVEDYRLKDLKDRKIHDDVSIP